MQYHARDCLKAAQQLGIRCRKVIEKSDIHRITIIAMYEAMNELKPDAIFLMDHVRIEEGWFPKELLVITWAQDPLPTIMDKATPPQLGERDILLNHFTTWKKFHELGYQNYCTVIDAPIPANNEIYKPYSLSKKEQELYECDISFVCHASDTDEYLENYLLTVDPGARLFVKALLLSYKDEASKTGKFLYSEEEFIRYIEGFCEWIGAGEIEPDTIKRLAVEMHLWYNQRVFRSLLVDWLVDAGYRNIKLWGNGWGKSEKYRDFAMGPAENGEILSKIYQASKINIGNNVLTTAAARVWECMLSGGFYLSNWIPEEVDITDIRKIVNFGEDIDYFCTKKEFLNKVEYYLSHEEERKDMIEKGYRAALEKMTYKKLMEKVLQVMKEKC